MTWKLDLHSPTTDNGTFTRDPPPPPPPYPRAAVLCDVYAKGLADLNNNDLSWVFTFADGKLIYKTA